MCVFIEVVQLCGFEATVATAADLARELNCSTDDLVTKSGDPIDGEMCLCDLDAEATAKNVGFRYDLNDVYSIRLIELARSNNPQPGSLFRCNGVTYLCSGVATGAGTSRKGRIVVYSDMETGRLFYRTPENFADRMFPIEAE